MVCSSRSLPLRRTMSSAAMIMPGVQIAALQPVMLAEGLLHRMQRAVRLGQALDGR